ACDPYACGDDGCGGRCGPCPADAPACDEGRCVAPPAVELREVFTVGEGPDWIELFNDSGAPVDLAGWALSDDPDDPGKWRCPPTVLGPGERLVVHATGRDLRPEDAPWETNFRLAGDGGFVGLAWRDGQTWVDTLDVPALRADVSYGRREAVTRTVLLGEGSPARWRAPAEDAWQGVDAPDGDWVEGALGLGFAGEPAAPDDPNLPNVAQGRPTRQTSQLGGYDAGRAVNGDLGDFTHTFREDLSPEWAVTLDGAPHVARVVLHNRSGCCGSRLRDVTVTLHDGQGAEVWRSPLLNPENVLGQGTSGPARLEVTPGVLAHEVRVQRAPDPDLSGTAGAGNADEPTVLSLAEVEVFAGQGGVAPAVVTDVGGVARGLGGIQVRVPFTVDDPARIDRLWLRVDHDAGFAVWLNGVPVGAERAPPLPLPADARALAEGPQAINRVELDLTAHTGLLRPGANLLALHALTADDDDLLSAPTLIAEVIEVGDWGYFPAPTPGAPNEGEAFDGWVRPVQFDRPHGWIDGPVQVALATSTPQAEVRYTLDGRAPGPEVGAVPEGRVAIEGSAVLRATAHRPGWLPAPVTTATWLMASDVLAQTHESVLARGFPEAWGNVAADYAVDPRVVGPGDLFEGRYAASAVQDLQSIPALALSLAV
ncbi:MAG: lamin tail domain-containing protein, partial [Myxococcales bacterium]|nr:lamin tail domain-containing protein [Myxococcales bacterium]